ncbi:hypothetical protein ACFE04_023032 [Oxalis oulophora]
MKKDDATYADGSKEVEVVCENVSKTTPEKKKNVIPKMFDAQRTILKGKKVVGENSSPVVAEKNVKERTFNHEMPPPVIPPSPTSVDVVVDDSKLMELMDIAMSSARKGKKGESSASTDFSRSPVDNLIVEKDFDLYMFGLSM